MGFLFGFQVLPTLIFFSALCSMLSYCGGLQKVVWAFAWLTKRFLKPCDASHGCASSGCTVATWKNRRGASAGFTVWIATPPSPAVGGVAGASAPRSLPAKS